MKVGKLIEQLQQMDENKEVNICDSNYKTNSITNISEESMNVVIDIDLIC